MQHTNTHIFTNRDENTLIKEFQGVLENNRQIRNLDAVVGFLRASGYFSLRPLLDSIGRVRVLIGIDVDRYIAEAVRQGRRFFSAGDDVKRDCLDLIRKDIESSSYRKDVEDGMFHMVQDLLDGKLEVRAHPTKRIHAKIYVLYPDGFNQYTQGVAITGSSNLSGNGLGITEERQYEFNVKMTQHEDVQFAKDEFERLWEEAEGCEITAGDLKISMERTYLKGDVAPYDLYIKMLMSYFSGRVLEADSDSFFDMPEGYSRFDYQVDAVVEGYQKLMRYDGFFLADVVGLGKTIIATMIAKKFLMENGADHTKILVVYPPAVELNWKATFKDFGIDRYAKFISYASLAKVLDGTDSRYWNADEYDLVLVDEAHKFRNSTISAFEQLQEICKMPRVGRGNVPGYRKKVMLITATPMNNSPADLYNEIVLFQDPRRCTIDGVGNLNAFFAPLIDEFEALRANPGADGKDFKRLSEKFRDRVIRPLTVRRTRTDLADIPRYSKELEGFPRVGPPVESRYELNGHLADLFERTMVTLVEGLTYARYRAIAYLKPQVAQGRYDNAESTSSSLARIRKTGLVKRLESSCYAFQISINNFRIANQNMIDMFRNGKIFIAPDLDINSMLKTMSAEEIEERLQGKGSDDPRNAVFCADDFRPEFMEMLLADQELLDQMWSDWRSVSDDDDSKFAKFYGLLKHELFRLDRNPEQKLVVFSESADTVSYLKRRIGRKDVLAVTSDNRGMLFNAIRENFDANSKVRRNDYSIVITTDVLAEGINLHRANVIVNYDTPWNASRLLQRIGRVNRIGAKAKRIYNYVFYPSREGNREINLNQIARSKIQTILSTFGEDYQIYSREEIIDPSEGKLFDENFDRNLELTFYEELRSLYLTNRREYDRIASLSLRSRTGRRPRQVEGVTLSGDSLVFLKTNFRKAFFLVSDRAEEISPLDALKYFRALPDEPLAPRIAVHHGHIGMALERFHANRSLEMQQEELSRDSRRERGVPVNTAINLLNLFMGYIKDSDARRKVEQLKVLLDRGTLACIARRLQRIQRDLSVKRARLTREEALGMILEMAERFDPYYRDEETLRNGKETDAEIILSESFQ